VGLESEVGLPVPPLTAEMVRHEQDEEEPCSTRRQQ